VLVQLRFPAGGSQQIESAIPTDRPVDEACRRFADGPFARRRLFLLDWAGVIFFVPWGRHGTLFSPCVRFHNPGLIGLHVMEWVDYLRDEAAKYRRLAEQTDDPVIKDEMLELASVCEEVANNIEDRLTGG
jgi:hypothetical protein